MKKNLLLLFGFIFSAFASLQAQLTVTDLGQKPQFGDISAIDIDNDGDLDLLVGGENDGIRNIQIYLNNGSGVFTPSVTSFTAVARPTFDWNDINNDGKPDLIMSGFPAGAPPFAKIYTSDGTGAFTPSAIVLPQLAPSCGFADLNNDGFTDIFVFGNKFECKAKILFSNGGTGFTESAQFDAYKFIDPVVTVIDFDNDKDLDLFVTAGDEEGAATRFSRMFVNNNGVFTEMAIAGLLPKGNGSAVWGDYNGDGYPDLLLNGDGYANSGEDADNYRLYRNNAGLTFTAIQAFGYRQNNTGNGGRFADWDNDGDLDIIVSGYNGNRQAADIYLNNAGVFSAFANNDKIPGSSEGSIEVADVNGDSKLDLLVSGYSGNDFDGEAVTTGPYNRNIAVIVTNPSGNVNVKPTAPTALQVTGNQALLTFSWIAGTDATTPQNALTYNLFLRNNQGKYFYVPLADTLTGFVTLPRSGNVQWNTGWILKNLPPGNYHWGVQSIDNSFAGSVFATGNFVINADGTLPVVLSSFTAVAENKKARVEWVSESETNSDHFDVERSVDGQHFKAIGSVKSKQTAGANKYTFYDNAPLNGNNLYRLIQYDRDGKRTSHGVRSVNFKLLPGASVMAFPNPATDNIGIRLINFDGKQVQVNVMDLSGKIIHAETISTSPGAGYYKLNMSLPPGGQYLILVKGDGLNETLKAVVK